MKRTVKGALVVALSLLFVKENALAQDNLPIDFIVDHARQLVQTAHSQVYQYNEAVYEKFYHRWYESDRPEDRGFVVESRVPLSPKVSYYYSAYQVFDIKIEDSNTIHTVGIGRCYPSLEEYSKARS